MFNGPLKIDPTVSASVVIPPAKAQTLFHHVQTITLAYYIICTLYAHSGSGHIAHVQHVLHKPIRQLTPPLLCADPERV